MNEQEIRHFSQNDLLGDTPFSTPARRGFAVASASEARWREPAPGRPFLSCGIILAMPIELQVVPTWTWSDTLQAVATFVTLLLAIAAFWAVWQTSSAAEATDENSGLLSSVIGPTRGIRR